MTGTRIEYKIYSAVFEPIPRSMLTPPCILTEFKATPDPRLHIDDIAYWDLLPEKIDGRHLTGFPRFKPAVLIVQTIDGEALLRHKRDQLTVTNNGYSVVKFASDFEGSTDKNSQAIT